MSALTNLSDVVNRLTGGNSGTPEAVWAYIDGTQVGAAPVAGRLSSTWIYTKNPGGAGAVPGAAAVPDNTTNGGLFQTDPGGGREKWLLGGTVVMSQLGSWILYDRLLHNGGLSGTTITAQTVGGTLTRNTGGIGNQIWIEIYTAVGTTGTTITASYTNQAGTSGRTTKTQSFGATNNREAQRIIPLSLQDGDTGVQSVQSVTVLASTTTAGSFGVTIARPLLFFPCHATGAGGMRDLIAGLPEIRKIDTDACLATIYMSNNTSAPQGFVSLSTIEA
jgi:hypothetical protein